MIIGRHDVVIIGAGPAGLFLAREIKLKSPSKRVAIIERGYKIEKRYCPSIENKKSCSPCNICQVAYGFGGAGMYSDGKLSTFPAGSGLLKIVNNDSQIKEINSAIISIFTDLSDRSIREFKSTKVQHASSSKISRLTKETEIILKPYDVIHLGSETVQYVSKQLAKQIEAQLSETDFHYSTELQDIQFHKDGFEVIYSDLKGEDFSLIAKVVVIATGKSSGLLLRNIMKNLGVEYEYNVIELGTRLELPRTSIDLLTESHLDAKLKLDLPHKAGVRSFCICNGGYLTRCFYDGFIHDRKICTISGYSLKDKKSDNSNFAVLVRNSFSSGIDPITTTLPIVQSINCAAGNNHTIVQRYEDFIANRATEVAALHNNSIKSNLTDPIPLPSNIRWFLPFHTCNAIEIFLGHLQNIIPSAIIPDTLMHFPVWEMCWDKVKFNNSIKTNIPNLYVIGDASGIARGIIQSATMGVIAARDILNTHKA